MQFNALQKAKAQQRPFAGLALYDALFAAAAQKAELDFLLVGDSLGQNVCGESTTVSVTVDQMEYHARAVSKGAPNTWIMVDMPYMSYSSIGEAFKTAKTLMQTGVHCLKMECTPAHMPILKALCEQGIPICAHIGLTPQLVHHIGGYFVAGRDADSASSILNLAQQCTEAGAQVLLLECMSAPVAAEITARTRIPVIGIGASNVTDGQILVASDIVGLSGHTLRFAHNFLPEAGSIQNAFAAFKQAVLNRSFPSNEHTYS